MFEYILEKVENAELRSAPYRHLYIADFFSPEHLDAILNAPEIRIPSQQTDDTLFDALYACGYKIVNFPGCTTEQKKYVDWHKSREPDDRMNSACEGFGVTLRLFDTQSDTIASLRDFIASEPFNAALARKLGVHYEKTFRDNGIQKYLDGYEISPHPDNRNKALTFMVNVNPHEDSESLDHHTHYMTLKPERSYLTSFWRHNPDIDTCWVPWDWCETVKQQTRNNSLVAFAPSPETLHGVRARYDHLRGQRTQLYGNLWYSDADELTRLDWEELDLRHPSRRPVSRKSAKSRIASLLPQTVRRRIKSAMKRNTDTVVRVRLGK